MSRKMITIAALAAVSLTAAAGTAVADEPDAGEEGDAVEVECPDPDEGGDEGESALEAAAEDAAAAAEALEGDEVCDDLKERNEQAVEALTAAMERLSEEGVGGNGVAADVLQALIKGESPAGIGAEHGAEMAAAAAERREARAAERAEEGRGKPEHAGKPDHAGKPEGVGRP